MGITSKQSWIRRNPKTTLVLTILFLILFLDLVGTGIYHLVKYGSIHKYEYLRVMRIKDPIFHHTLKPEAEYTLEKWGSASYTLTTNSLGFKDKQVKKVSLSSNKYRLLFMGDSFTEGMGVGYEDTFVGQVDQALSQGEFEVLNGGVASYSPAIYFKKTEYLMKTLGLEFDEVIVFLDISDINDDVGYDIRDEKVVAVQPIDWSNALRDFFFEYTMIPRNIWSASEKFYRKFVKDPDSHSRSKEDHSYGTNTYRSLWTVDDTVYAAYGEQGLKKCKHHMDLLYRLLKDHGIKMTVAVYPQPDQILHHDVDSRQVKFWKDWTAEHSVSFLNFFPDFIQQGQEPKEVIRKYFIHGDLHWNDEGHRLIATKFLEWWKAENALEIENSIGLPDRPLSLSVPQ